MAAGGVGGGRSGGAGGGGWWGGEGVAVRCGWRGWGTPYHEDRRAPHRVPVTISAEWTHGHATARATRSDLERHERCRRPNATTDRPPDRGTYRSGHEDLRPRRQRGVRP